VDWLLRSRKALKAKQRQMEKRQKIKARIKEEQLATREEDDLFELNLKKRKIVVDGVDVFMCVGVLGNQKNKKYYECSTCAFTSAAEPNGGVDVNNVPLPLDKMKAHVQKHNESKLFSSPLNWIALIALKSLKRCAFGFYMTENKRRKMPGLLPVAEVIQNLKPKSIVVKSDRILELKRNAEISQRKGQQQLAKSQPELESTEVCVKYDLDFWRKVRSPSEQNE